MSLTRFALEPPVRVDEGRFTGAGLDHRRVRAYGGALLVQACLVAREVSPPTARIRSAFTYFLRAADGSLPIDLHTRPISRGRTLTIHEVDVSQDGKEVVHATISLDSHSEAQPPGRSSALGIRPAGQPGDTWPGLDDRQKERIRLFDKRHDWEILFAEAPIVGSVQGPASQSIWARPRVEPSDVPEGVEDLFVMYASDMYTPGIAAATVGGFLGTDHAAVSITQAVTVTGRYRPGDWIGVHHECEGLAGNRGVVHTRLCSQDGAVLGEAVQEVLVSRIERSG